VFSGGDGRSQSGSGELVLTLGAGVVFVGVEGYPGAIVDVTGCVDGITGGAKALLGGGGHLDTEAEARETTAAATAARKGP
jgi:hypothetical protein